MSTYGRNATALDFDTIYGSTYNGGLLGEMVAGMGYASHSMHRFGDRLNDGSDEAQLLTSAL